MGWKLDYTAPSTTHNFVQFLMEHLSTNLLKDKSPMYIHF